MTIDEEYLKKVNAIPKQYNVLQKIVKLGEEFQVPMVLEDYAIMPTKSHGPDAGLDFYSPVDTVLWGNACTRIDTGVRLLIPEGFYGDMRSRSSMFGRNTSTDGTIDAGYTGIIAIQIQNHNSERLFVKRGEKIAQMVFTPFIAPKLVLVDKLPDTERGNNGFGSTGK